MTTHRRITDLTLSLLTTAALALTLCAPATARQDPGRTTHTAKTPCALERIGTQLVRCDNLTGDGVPAPLYIPEQR
jgi:hypothetical protein